MSFLSNQAKISNTQQSGNGNRQHFGDIHYHETSPALEAKKSSIIQDILENIIDLSVTLEASTPDTVPFDIERKIDHNCIIYYKTALEILMENKFIIEERLNILETNGNTLARQKLFKVVRNIYSNHCRYEDPDEVIRCMELELKNELTKFKTLGYDDITFIPSIIFYVFTECKIFKKPPIL